MIDAAKRNLSSACLSTRAITNCWETIESYSYLDDVIALSSTCKILNELIVDKQNGWKARVSHCEHQLVRYPEHRVRDISPSIDYVAGALGSMSFPSLKRLRVDMCCFSEEEKGEELVHLLQAGCRICFPILAAQLAHAASLEVFHFNPGAVAFGYEWWINWRRQRSHELELFGRNLSKCNRLKELDIRGYFSDMHQGYEHELKNNMFIYNIGFPRSFIPILRRNVLQSFVIKFHAPTPLDDTDEDLTESHSVWSMFFEALLSSENLRTITLDADALVGHEHVSEHMIKAMGRVHDKGCRLSQLKSLDVTVYSHGTGLPEGLDRNLFKYVSDCCNSSTNIRLCLYKSFWNHISNLQMVEDFLISHANLSSLEIDFSGSNQLINRTLRLIHNFVKAGSPEKPTYISLANMSFVKAKTLSVFADWMADEGWALDRNSTTLLEFDTDSDEEGDLIGDIEKYGSRRGGQVLALAISFRKAI